MSSAGASSPARRRRSAGDSTPTFSARCSERMTGSATGSTRSPSIPHTISCSGPRCATGCTRRPGPTPGRARTWLVRVWSSVFAQPAPSRSTASYNTPVGLEHAVVLQRPWLVRDLVRAADRNCSGERGGCLGRQRGCLGGGPGAHASTQAPAEAVDRSRRPYPRFSGSARRSRSCSGRFPRCRCTAFRPCCPAVRWCRSRSGCRSPGCTRSSQS
jgi:hypothetical protein